MILWKIETWSEKVILRPYNNCIEFEKMRKAKHQSRFWGKTKVTKNQNKM